MYNKDIFKKIAISHQWTLAKGQTYRELCEAQGITLNNLPPNLLIDIVYCGGMDKWASNQNVESEYELRKIIFDAYREARLYESDKYHKMYPLYYDLCVQAKRIFQNVSGNSKIDTTAEIAFLEISKRKMKERVDKLFSVEPDKNKYLEASKKMKEVYNFSDTDIDALRYFVCQVRKENFNPSLNKSLYLFSEKKMTGKTSIARTIASILNGGKSVIDGAQFESSFNVELQMNSHDLPACCKYNCVILDEAMPRDARKTYGRVKSMLTTNNVTYNQKYGSIKQLEAKRRYIFTSNEDISKIIQDESERRFIQIKMNSTPERLNDNEIYNLFLKFAVNCEPEKDIQKWYNSFDTIAGVERADKEYYKSSILSCDNLYNLVNADFDNSKNRYFALRFFVGLYIIGKPTRDERDILESAIIELFGERHKNGWLKTTVRDKLDKLRNNDESEGANVQVIDDIPF